MDLGHWQYPAEFDPTKWFGFIYRIIDNTNGKHYIGKKQFGKTRRKVVKNRVNRKIVKSESDWREYMSSSDHVKAAIAEKGKENFTFLIESLHKTKSSLHYAEVERQVNEDVLRAKLPSGEKKFYNMMVANMRFSLADITPDEAQHILTNTTRTFRLNFDNPGFAELTDSEKDELKVSCEISNDNATTLRLLTETYTAPKRTSTN